MMLTLSSKVSQNHRQNGQFRKLLKSMLSGTEIIFQSVLKKGTL